MDLDVSNQNRRVANSGLFGGRKTLPRHQASHQTGAVMQAKHQ